MYYGYEASKEYRVIKGLRELGWQVEDAAFGTFYADGGSIEKFASQATQVVRDVLAEDGELVVGEVGTRYEEGPVVAEAGYLKVSGVLTYSLTQINIAPGTSFDAINFNRRCPVEEYFWMYFSICKDPAPGTPYNATDVPLYRGMVFHDADAKNAELGINSCYTELFPATNVHPLGQFAASGYQVRISHLIQRNNELRAEGCDREKFKQGYGWVN